MRFCSFLFFLNFALSLLPNAASSGPGSYIEAFLPVVVCRFLFLNQPRKEMKSYIAQELCLAEVQF